jgi:hypothetical protein
MASPVCVMASATWPGVLAKLALEPDEFEQANRPIELNEEIDIAVLATFVAGERAKQRQTSDTEPVQQRAATTQHVQDVFASRRCMCLHRNHILPRNFD